MKKLINAPEAVVAEALAGLEAAHGNLLRVSYDPAYLVRADAPVAGKLAIVSGGGSGHEPLHGGFVGVGMLDAACPGAIFTSPTPDQMLAAAEVAHGGAGVLFIVKNYTGDIMNFDMAADLLREAGIAAEQAVINDDVAVQDSLYTAGRRGVGTTVLAEKLCGAAAAEGQDLSSVAALCRRVNAHGRSMGVALTSCTVPHAGKPTFRLAEDEIEMGIGIHGEPGRTRMKLHPADRVAEMLLEPVLADLPFARGDRVLLFVNGMGGTPLIELYVLYRRLSELCNAHGLTVARNLVGNYITSLEMAGASVTLLKLDAEMERLWDAPVHTAALRWGM